jgi:hypothetical protein
MTQSQVKAIETRELDLSYGDTYDACLKAMFATGMTIQHTDKTSGVITGQSGDHVQRTSAGAIWRPLFNVKKVTLMVKSVTEKLTQIRMSVLVNEQPQLDHKLMTKIWQQIDAEAMLESRPATPHAPTPPPAATETTQRPTQEGS